VHVPEGRHTRQSRNSRKSARHCRAAAWNIDEIVGQGQGEFELADRDELWKLLVTITLRKARNDEPSPDDAAKSRWRKQAQDWLRSDLAAWSKIMEDGSPQSRLSVRQAI